MRVIYVGCILFSKQLLESILYYPMIDLVGLMTKQKSTLNSDYYDLSKVIRNFKIPYKFLKSINDCRVNNWITKIDLDIIFYFGWSSLLKKDILNIPKIGSISIHRGSITNVKYAEAFRAFKIID